MRVIAGTAKGIPLRSPSTEETRPILGRAKEALFSILSPRIQDCLFLDLFAGTGGVGIEALSRGANGATFVELSPQIVTDLRYNLDRTHLADRALVRHMDVFAFLEEAPTRFDTIFLAPPQWKNMWQPALRILDAETDWLAEDGIVVVQHDPTEYRSLDLESLREYDRRRYAGVHLVFYERE